MPKVTQLSEWRSQDLSPPGAKARTGAPPSTAILSLLEAAQLRGSLRQGCVSLHPVLRPFSLANPCCSIRAWPRHLVCEPPGKSWPLQAGALSLISSPAAASTPGCAAFKDLAYLALSPSLPFVA